jgi:ABC-2 type transport system permease protein
MRLVLRQVYWEQKVYWRNPAAAVFTFAFPLVFLVVFAAINSDHYVGPDNARITFVQFYVPAIAGFGVISACYTNLAFVMSLRREDGTLKRKRGTPLPAPTYLMGVFGSTVLNTAVLVTLTMLLGVVAYDITIPDPAGRLPVFALTIAAGALCFTSLGMLVSTFVPNEDAAPAIINLLLFPILFISGTFSEIDSGSFVDRIATIFPVRAFNHALIDSVNPFESGGIQWGNLAILAAWTVGATLLAVKRFRWEPSAESGRRRGRSARSSVTSSP